MNQTASPEFRLKMIAQIALLAHQVIKSYCEALGDRTHVDWHKASDAERAGKCRGVELVLDNPNASPETLHNAWLADKVNQGWRLGNVKDEASKQHPCIRPFDGLPIEQQIKDHLFIGVVRAVTYSQDIPEAPPLTDQERMMLEDKQLHGSSLYIEGQSIPMVGGVTIDISVLTGAARRAAGYSIEEWNNLPQDTIDSLVEAKIGMTRDELTGIQAMGATRADFEAGAEKPAKEPAPAPVTDEQARSTLAVDLGLPADASQEQIDAEMEKRTSPGEVTSPDVATTADVVDDMLKKHDDAKADPESMM